MKITIDDKICLKHKMTFEEFLMALMYRQVKSPREITNNLLNREIVVNHGGQYLVTQRWSEVIDEILADSQGSERTDDELMELARKMRDAYPQGRMIDRYTGRPTTYYFRCNVPEVAKKLKTFFARYGNFSDEDILDAEKRYVASYNGNYQQKGFRLIKYFILKDDVKQGPDGNYVEPLSPLLDFLSNKESEEVVGGTNSDDWMMSVRN